MTQPTIALLGTGSMGSGMARNLLAAGLDTTVWNRNPARAAPLRDLGARLASSPAEAVHNAGIIITMLFDEDSVREVISQTRGAAPADAIWIQTSTVGVAGSERLAVLAEGLGLAYVDAPVLGTKKPAEDGTLVVVASGPSGLQARCAPVFDAIGSRTMWVSSGSALKLVVNAWVLTVLEGLAESLTFAAKLGLEPELFLQAVRGGPTGAPYLDVKGHAMLTQAFAPSFAVLGASKDAELILQAAGTVEADMAVVGIAQRYLRAAIDAGHGDLDMAATYLGR
jgi:3-hydroxyisobutyrate dehydrogenase